MVDAQESPRSPQFVRRLEDCSGFFRIPSGRILFFGLGGTCFHLSGGRGSLVAIGGSVAGATTEQAKVIVEMALSFLLCQLPVFTEFVGKGISRGGGRQCFVGFVVIAVLVAFGDVGVVGVVVVRGARVIGGVTLAFVVRLFAFIGFVVGFVVRLVLARTGFLPDTFPMTGIDSVQEASWHREWRVSVGDP